MAIRGALDAADGRAGVVTTRVEHPAVLETCRAMQEAGHKVVHLGVDNGGQIHLEQLKNALQEKPAVVTAMWANNETGVVFPIEEMARLTKEAGGLFHSDAVQSVGKLPVDLRRVPVDMLSMSGHKLHAPKGIGALYIRRGTKIRPFMLGGHQEGGRRAGTENVPYIVGLGRACELAAKAFDETKRIAALRDRLEKGILAACSNARVNGDRKNRLPNTSNISFENIEGEAILLHMSDLGISASSGSACTSGSLEPSHVIRAMGVPFTAAHGSTRFSLSRYTTEAEIDYTIEQVPKVIRRLLEISPFA
jgi:cysteine desulfurase